MEEENWDVIVVGAGPAGSSAALELANAGYRVKVIDKERVIPDGRYKACGGAMAWELVEEVNYPAELIAREIESLNLHHVDGELYHKDGKGAVVWRATFDKYVLDLAIQAGADFEENTPLLQIEENTEDTSAVEYLIRTPSKELHSKFVIAADGVNSPTLKQLGFPAFTKDDLVLTITQEVHVGAEKIAECLGPDSVHLFFGCENFISMGYAWLFPKEDVISVGWGNLVSKIR